MVKSLKCSLSISAFWLFAIVISSCAQQHEWYKNELTENEKSIWAERLLNGAGRYYQGTVPEQFLLTEAATLDPQNSSVLREQGVAWLKRGFGIQMNQYFEKAVEVDPVAWQGYRGYNYLYFYRDYKRAIADFAALDTLTADTDYPQGQSVDYMRGLCHLGLNEYDKAIDYFTKYINEVTETDGESWVDIYAFLYRGITHLAKGDLKLARKDFETGSKYYEELSDFNYHLAYIEMKEGNKKKAQSYINDAQKAYQAGFYHQRSYVTVQEQLHSQKIEALSASINAM